MKRSEHILQANYHSLVELLRSKALQKPDHVSYTYLVGGDKEELKLTYRQVDQKARAIAARLQKLIATGERAILIYPGGLEFIPAFFGCLYAGVIAVPCFPPRDKRDLSTLGLIAADCGSRIVLTDKFLSAIAQGQTGQFPELNNFTWLATDQLENDIDESGWKEPVISCNSLACIMYTSGSTRVPAGVMISHQNILESMISVTHDLGFTSKDILLSWVSYFHVMGLMLSVLGPIYKDVPVILFPPESFSERPMCWLQAVSDYKATISLGPNFAYEMCAGISTPQERSTLDLNCWRLAGTGAEAIRFETIKRFSDTFADCGFQCEAFYSGYGLTEATVLVTGSHVFSGQGVIALHRSSMNENNVVEVGVDAEDAVKIVSCGKVYHNQDAKIVQPIKHTPCAPHEIGEVWISGPNVAAGYWNKPKETRNVFHGYLSDTGEGPFLRTGDLGFIKNGELFITGRYKDLIVIHGCNYYPSDIEVSAEKSHPSIQRGASTAFSVPVDVDEHLIIVVEHKRGLDRVDVEEIAQSVRLAVAQHHHLPVYAVVVVQPGSIPRTGIGKIQRFKCREEYLASRIASVGVSYLTVIQERPVKSGQIVARPRTPLEYELCEIFKDVLGCESVNIDDNFFALGGDSLLATQAVSRVCARFMIDLPIPLLFEHPTVASLASHIDSIIYKKNVLLPPIQQADRSLPLPLSFSQERLWLIYQLQPDNTAYNVPSAVQINSRLNFSALEKAVNLMIQRYEILRTSFNFDGHNPCQEIAPSLSIKVQSLDLRDVPTDRQKDKLNELVDREAQKPFDLSQLPLFRVYLYLLADENTILFLNIHHIIADAWSMSVFYQELYKIYQSLESDQPVCLQPVAFQYADFAQWQRNWFTGDILEEELSYWRKQLDGVPIFELPFNHRRPPVQTYRGSQVATPLPDSLYTGLNELSHKAGVSFFMTALSAFYVLLYRYSGQVDIPVGVPIANRRWLSVEELIGTLVNTLVMRANLDGGPSFIELVNRVRGMALDAYAHQDMPFERLVAELKPERDLSHAPLFQVMFNLINIPMSSFEQMGLDQSKKPDLFLEIDHGGAQFELTLTVVDTPDERRVILNYNSDLFEREAISRMLGHYMNLLEAVVQNPQGKIEELPLLTAAERAMMLVEWNETRTDYQLDMSISSAFEAQAAATPQAVAVIEGEKQITFKKLNEKANHLAHYLRDLGVGNETLVAVCLNRSIDLFVAILGILKAGGAYLPLDPTYPNERLSFMLHDSGALFLITQRHLARNLSLQNTRTLYLDEESALVDQKSSANPIDPPKGDNLAYVIYTSGSTGLPKGVKGHHRGTLNRFHWMWEKYPFGTHEICCQKTALSFVDSIWETFGPLLKGVPVVIIADEAVRDFDQLIQILRDKHVTRIVLVPSLLKTMLETNPQLPSLIPDLKFWVSSGETLSLEQAKRFHELMPGQTLLNLYGSSEVAADCTFYETTVSEKHTTVPIGRPISNIQAYLLDAYRQPVPLGVPGEIYIGGIGVAQGYLNRSNVEASKFIPNIFNDSSGARLFKTGDMGRYLPDGNIEYLGRNDRQIKIHGCRVELGEIEQVLKNASGIDNAVVTSRLDTSGSTFLVACIVVKKGISPNLVELRSYLKNKLPEYMLPAVIIVLDKLPLLPNGKIDYEALAAMDNSSMDQGAYVAPSTPVEEKLVAIWEDLLDIRPVGITQNFFELGGHSLLAVRLFAEVNKYYGKHISLNTIFEGPTIRQLAEKIGIEPDNLTWPSLVPIQPKGEKPPLFFVHPFGGDVIGFNLWAQHLGINQPFYGLRARGLDGIQKPLSRIEEMASAYLAELRLVQPRGPYYLGGYCIGGVIAFEMAQQLHRQGERVALLAIVNQPPPNSGYYRFKLSPRFVLAFLRNLPYWSVDFIQLRKREMLARLVIQSIRIKASMRKWIAKLLRREDKGNLEVSEETIKIRVSQYPEYQQEYINSYFHNFVDALAFYQPHVFAGHIVLFRTPRQPLVCSFDTSLCWDRLAGVGIDVVVVPGSNTTLTRDPYALEFARQLKTKLDAAQNGNLSHDQPDTDFRKMRRMPIP